jgi:hypothetical protein
MKISEELKKEYMRGLEELAGELERAERYSVFRLQAGFYAEKFCRKHDIYDLLILCGGNAIILYALFGAKGDVHKFEKCLKIIREPDF